MNWFDTVLALPAVGVRFRPNFQRAFRYADSAGPFADRLNDEDGRVNIQWETPGNFVVETPPRGFRYTVRPNELIVEFKFPVASKRAAGAVVEVHTTESKSFSEVLTQSVERFDAFHRAFAEDGINGVERLGIAIQSRLIPDSLPPGVEDLLRYLSKPLGRLTKCDTTLLATLEEQQDHLDRCHYMVAFDQTVDEGEVRFTLDWQRVFSPVRDFSSTELKKEVERCKTKALGYFEFIGSGGLKYD